MPPAGIGFSGCQYATMLSWISRSEGISTSSTWPRPQSPFRLDPQRRPAIVLRFGVLEVRKIALALQQAEALRALVDERGYLQGRRVCERPPDPLAVAVQDLQSVRVVHGVAIVVEARTIRGVEQEHRRQWRDAESTELYARKQRSVDVDDRLVAGLGREREGADDGRALEQRVNHDPLGAFRRPLDPEVRPRGELLTLAARRAHRQTARRQAVELAARDGAEIARALKHEKLVLVVRPVDRRAHAKPRIRGSRDRQRARCAIGFEQIVVEQHAPRRLRDHEIDVHGDVVDEPGIEQIDSERSVFAVPDRRVGTKSDRPVLVVVELELGRIAPNHVDVRMLRELFRFRQQHVTIERLGRSLLRARHPAKQHTATTRLAVLAIRINSTAASIRRPLSHLAGRTPARTLPTQY